MDWVTFNQRFFENYDINWHGRTGVLSLDENRNAKIVLSTRKDGKISTSGKYVSYFVKIVHKQNGTIASQVFQFADHMYNPDKVEDCYDGFKVIDHCCRDGIARWYRQKPTDKEVEKMANEIMNYIEEWR